MRNTSDCSLSIVLHSFTTNDLYDRSYIRGYVDNLGQSTIPSHLAIFHYITAGHFVSGQNHFFNIHFAR